MKKKTLFQKYYNHLKEQVAITQILGSLTSTLFFLISFAFISFKIWASDNILLNKGLALAELIKKKFENHFCLLYNSKSLFALESSFSEWKFMYTY